MHILALEVNREIHLFDFDLVLRTSWGDVQLMLHLSPSKEFREVLEMRNEHVVRA